MTNHYAPPQSEVADVNRGGSGGITSDMIDALRGTKPWVLLIGIVLFISSAFMVLGAFGMMAAGTMGGTPNGPPRGVFTGMGVGYVIGGIIYIVMGVYLVKYSSAIGKLVQSGSAGDMEDALVSQRKFWKFAGILTLLMIVFAVIGMAAAMVIPFMAMGH
ncbi:MAG: DUF5362 family protein [Gammaproteobacteria bacterium]